MLVPAGVAVGFLWSRQADTKVCPTASEGNGAVKSGKGMTTCQGHHPQDLQGDLQSCSLRREAIGFLGRAGHEAEGAEASDGVLSKKSVLLAV